MNIKSFLDSFINFFKKVYDILHLSKVIEAFLLIIWKLLFEAKPLFSM